MQPKKRSPEAIYSKIARSIREQIASGQIAPGESVGTEAELCHAWSASRSTVRTALRELAKEGVLTARQGLGWFVSEPRLHQRLAKLEPLNDSLSRQGIPAHFQLNSFLFTRAPADIASSLELAASDDVLAIERVHFSDHTPLAVVSLWLVEWVGDRITVEDAKTRPIFPILPEKAGVRIHRSQQSIRAIGLGSRESRLLGLDEGAPALQVDRVSYTKSERPIAFSRFQYRADRFEFRISLDWLDTDSDQSFNATGVGLRAQDGEEDPSPQAAGTRSN